MDTLRWIERAAAWITVIFIAWRLYRLYRIRPTSDQPRCAKCNYIVRDLMSATCPECGSNFLSSGVVPPGVLAVHGGRFAISIIVLVTLCGVSSAFLKIPLAFWRESSYGFRASYYPRHGDVLPVSLSVETASWGWQGVLPPRILHAKIESPSGDVVLAWDGNNHVWTASSGARILFRAASLGPADIQNCASGTAVGRVVAADMADLANQCTTLVDTRPFDIPVATFRAPPGEEVDRLSTTTGSNVWMTVFLSRYAGWLLAILWAVFLPKIAGQGNRVLYYQHAAKILRTTSQATPKPQIANEAPSTEAHLRAGGPPNE